MYERLTIRESGKLDCEHCVREKKVCSATDCTNIMYNRLYELENKMEDNKPEIETNRDWINSLSDVEFAWVFFSFNPPIYEYFSSHTDSKNAFRQWLAQEYQPDSRTYEYFKTGVIPTQWISPSVGHLGHKE